MKESFLQLSLGMPSKPGRTSSLRRRCGRHHGRPTGRNSYRRFSARQAVADMEHTAPRYWLLHTRSHVLIREMAISWPLQRALTERIYGWPPSAHREGAAGLLICTTALRQRRHLGGLSVALSEPPRLQAGELWRCRAARCSSDPVCAMRTPHDPEDFLHGAACHCCTFSLGDIVREANRFLDRRFLLRIAQRARQPVPGFLREP